VRKQKAKHLTTHYSIPTTHISLLIAFFCISIFANAQSVSYGYDASGNRISRTIVMPMNAPPQDSTETIIEEEDLIAGNEKTQEVYTDTLADTQIAIYPNPTKGLLTIEMSDMRLSDMGLSDMRYETCDIAIFDMMGKCVWSSYGLTVLRHYSLQINISHLPAGTYIMRIAIEDEVVNWKIIKQ
jgi:hypothetical protein